MYIVVFTDYFFQGFSHRNIWAGCFSTCLFCLFQSIYIHSKDSKGDSLPQATKAFTNVQLLGFAVGLSDNRVPNSIPWLIINFSTSIA